MTDLIQSRTRCRAARAARAAQIREFRTKYIGPAAEDKCDRKFVNKLLLQELDRNPPPPKATTAGLFDEAVQNLAYSRTPVRSIQNEYYSSCGLEDAAWERRQESRRHAVECYRGYLALCPAGERDQELDAELADVEEREAA